MAEKLDNVTHLPARKAKGAGGTGKPQREQPKIVAQAAAEVGDNMTPEQEAKALRIHHVAKLRAQSLKVDAARAVLDSERQVMTDLFHVAKADTHIQRKEFTALLAAMSKSRAELEEEEKRRAELWGDWDLPVGYQGDLFAGLPQEARDHEWAKGLGYAAGLRGDPCIMPEGMEPRFGQPFGEGWGKGQEELSWALSAAGRIVDRRNNPAKPVSAVPLEPVPPDEPDLEAQVAAHAEQLKAEGFTEKAPVHADEFS